MSQVLLGSDYGDREIRRQALIPEIPMENTWTGLRKLFCGCAPFVVLFVVSLVLFLGESETPSTTATSWRLIPSKDASAPDLWRVCGIRLYSDEFCSSDPIAPTAAKTLVWDGKTHIPLELFSGSSSCVDIWSSNQTSVPWVGIEFDSKVQVRCARVTQDTKTTGCSRVFSSGCFFQSCDVSFCYGPCCLRTTASLGFPELSFERSNHPERSGSWHAALKTSSPGSELLWGETPKTSTQWVVYLVLLIVFASCVFIGLLIAPILYCASKATQKHTALLQTLIHSGDAIAYQCDDVRWREFVVGEYGPGGRRRKALLSWSWLLAILLTGPAVMLAVKIKSWNQHLPWKTLAMTCIPAGAGFMVVVWLMAWVFVLIKFQRYLRHNVFVVIGPNSIHFDGLHLLTPVYKRADSCSAKRPLIVKSSKLMQFADGLTLVVNCDRVVKEGLAGPKLSPFVIRLPLDDSNKTQVSQFLQQHSALYKPQASVPTAMARPLGAV